jgi:hypothetical protein
MATKKEITERTVSIEELAELIKAYWENQNNGLKIWSSHDCFFDYRYIRNWLSHHNLNASDAEIVDAHRKFFENWLKTVSGISKVIVSHAGLDDRDRFHISIQITPIAPIRRHYIPAIDDSGVVSPDMMAGTDSLILGTTVPPRAQSQSVAFPASHTHR